MKDIRRELGTWLDEEAPIALATVIATERSAPHDPGASMAVRPGPEVLGSVSGGCVEGAVVEEALQVLRSGTPRRLRYGISDELAGTVGLTCGGTIHLWVERIDDRKLVRQALDGIETDRPVAVCTVLAGEQAGAKLLVTVEEDSGGLSPAALRERVVHDARSMLAAGLTGIRTYGPRGEARGTAVEVFVQSFAPPPAMYVFGATDFARATAAIGKFLGYRVTVCDARSTFLTRIRFPEADELVVRWPDEFLAEAPVDQRTAICILTHDPKFDVPLLEAALATDAGYIGAMGSRRTDEERTRELRARGTGAAQLARIRGPIGLDIGARTPQEVAVAIAGEIISTRSGATGGFLRERSGAVHDVGLATRPAAGVPV